MDEFLQLLVNSLTLGGLYALLALGYSLVYGVLKLLNFAHGDVYMVGALIGLLALEGMGAPGSLAVPVALALFVAFLAAAVGCGALGVVIERFAYRPLRDAPRVASLITALGISFFLQYAVLLLFGHQTRLYETSEYIPFSDSIHIGDVTVWIVRLLVIVLAVVLMLGLRALVDRTRLGTSMRAVAYDREAAEMMGIDVNRTVAMTFIVGSALAGVAGVMAGLVFNQVFSQMGFLAGLKAFSAAVIGGIGNIVGAMLGGLLIGFAEVFTTTYISSTYQNLIVFAALIVVMLVRPNGLLGRAPLEKV